MTIYVLYKRQDLNLHAITSGDLTSMCLSIGKWPLTRFHHSCISFFLLGYESNLLVYSKRSVCFEYQTSSI